ncbi:MAG: CHRD domain-containing protein [Chloroflexota bacterium]
MDDRSRVNPALAAALGLLATLALSGTVLAAETTLTADLAGGADSDEDGTGTATVVLDPEAGTACWEMSVADIDPVTISHIHVGAEGESGDVVVDLDLAGFETDSEGCNDAAVAETLQAIIDDPAGYYVNVHNEAFPGGAIRGQLAGGSEPPDTALPMAGGPAALFGALLLAFAVAIGLRAKGALTSD